MKKKKSTQMNSRNILIIMTIICIAVIAVTITEVVPVAPIRNAASAVIVPFQKGINEMGSSIASFGNSFRNAGELSQKVDELENKNSTLEEENLLLREDEQELARLRDLYELDGNYSQFEKIAAKIISRDSGNWYSTFIIDKGSLDGIDTEMNVLASGGLAGIVTEVGSDWATVRTIVDDTSSVSAMTLNTSDTCIVNGGLELRDKGYLTFNQMNTENDIPIGEQLVTSNISDKYLPGILIGTIMEISEDANHLTKAGTLSPAVDFQHIKEVFVITKTKDIPVSE